MAVRIRSLLGAGPIMIPLSTGRYVRLSPGQSSDKLQDVEVAANAKIDKLRGQGLIEVETLADEPSKEPEAKSGTKPRKDQASSG
jgi:hypothetical protein